MKKPFTPEQEEQIVNAIKKAELNTSGEIRVHIQKRCKQDIMEEAKRLFEKLGMTATEARNGVMIFVALDQKQLCVIGDKGINDVVPDNFWEETISLMLDRFRQGDVSGGLEAGVLHAGEALKKHFPYQSDDVNELSDEISYE